MYENFYRFNEKPFSLAPDPKFLFLGKRHQGALDHVLYGIKQREGFISIVGDVGTGKTTLCRCLLSKLDENVQAAVVLNPMLSDMDLLRTCVHDLQVRSKPVFAGNAGNPGEFDSSNAINMDWVNRASKKELLDSLNAFLLERSGDGGSTVLIIDEAQNLPLDVMEQLRILSNLETEKEKLLQIIFVGQLELDDKLKSPELKRLNQRISIRYEILPLSPDESIQYINHRLLVAGGCGRVAFKPSAVKEIFKYSQGCPRLINLVCDRALLGGYNDQVDVIDRVQVNRGIQSLMGAEEKDHDRNSFIRFRFPVISCTLFFLVGLAFFIFSQMGSDWQSKLDEAAASIKKQLLIPLSSKLEDVFSRTEIRSGFTKKDAPAPAQTGVTDNKAVSRNKEDAPQAQEEAGNPAVGGALR